MIQQCCLGTSRPFYVAELNSVLFLLINPTVHVISLLHLFLKPNNVMFYLHGALL